MAWDKTKPATGADLLSADVRANWDALDAALMAVLAAGPAQSLLIIAAGGVAGKINPGTAAHVLTMVGGVPTWQAPAAGGMSNPMSGVGDMIVGAATGTPARLAPAADRDVLTLESGTPTWRNRPVAIVPLPLDAARFPDGTTGNAFPQPVERVSTGAAPAGAPKVVSLVYQFDPTTAEFLIWKITVPPTFVSGSTKYLVTKWSMVSATTGNVQIVSAVAPIVDGTTDVRAVSFGTVSGFTDVTVPATLGTQKETRTQLFDALVPGQVISVSIGFWPGSSNAAGDRVLEAAWMEFGT